MSICYADEGPSALLSFAALVTFHVTPVTGPAAVKPADAAGRRRPPPRSTTRRRTQSPARTCESLATVSLANTTIESATLDPGDATAGPSCRVTATLTHPPAGDKVRILLALSDEGLERPLSGRRRRRILGRQPDGVGSRVAQGFAAGSTDTGHEGGSGSFALDANGRLNWQLIRDNAYLGIHEMTVTGKALTQAFYGAAPRTPISTAARPAAARA